MHARSPATTPISTSVSITRRMSANSSADNPLLPNYKYVRIVLRQGSLCDSGEPVICLMAAEAA